MARHFDETNPIIGLDRRVAIAVDSCALLSPEFVDVHNVPVAPMRINIGGDSFIDSSDLNYSELYSRSALEPETRGWASAPVPAEWLETIEKASPNVEAVICLTVAAGLSASYDSARVAAEMSRRANKDLDVRVIDSGTISGALHLLATETVRATEQGLDANAIVEHIELTKTNLQTIATLDDLNRIHHIANTPRTIINLAHSLNVKPVVTFDIDEFRIVAKPMSMRSAIRRMLREISDDLGTETARFVVLHVDAPERARSIAAQIRESCDCELMLISDFHPFIGLYAGCGAIGIAWQKI